jgi:hypothetical protein
VRTRMSITPKSRRYKHKAGGVKMMARLSLIVASLLFAMLAQAETATGVVNSLGCHNVDGTCWVTLDQFGSSAYCNNSSQLRWDASTSWGSRWYATLLAAKLNGTPVWLYVNPDACHSQGYPTFVYGGI